jgi:hypothetical protein
MFDLHPWKCIEYCDACTTFEISNILRTIIIGLDSLCLLKRDVIQNI